MIYAEPLLWERESGSSIGFSIPDSKVKEYKVDKTLKRGEIKLPGYSETVITRHFTRLSTWNYGVDTGIYPLGSCTMKNNPKINEKLASIPGFLNSHPLVEAEYSQGVLEVLYRTGEFLKEITGLSGVTLQPAAGAHGELTSMLMFKKYHKERGEKRSTILIPDSAHGTNPASASLCGYKTKLVKSNSNGIIDLESIREVMDSSVAGLMITNPNTLGLFETNLKEICEVIHKEGGLVYLDGANLNALLGVVKLGSLGVDAMHINLHKTFATPHGGGGPGAGPVCVNDSLVPYLPKPQVVKEGDVYRLIDSLPKSIGRVHGFNGHFSVILKALCYILTMGSEGLKETSRHAVLNANYIKSCLRDYYNIPYSGEVMHEVLFTHKKQMDFDVSTMDIAKAIIDKGVHPPTIYFPLVVNGAILVEPTESESLDSLNRFISIMIDIANRVKSDPDGIRRAPYMAKRERIDETQAARKPILKGDIVE